MLWILAQHEPVAMEPIRQPIESITDGTLSLLGTALAFVIPIVLGVGVIDFAMRKISAGMESLRH